MCEKIDHVFLSWMLFALFLLSAAPKISAQQITNFPYSPSMQSGIQPAGWQNPVPETRNDQNSAVWTPQGLQLTDSKSQFGAAVLDGVSFNSTNGLEISFEFTMYGGEKYENSSYGDGFTFFLYDGSKEKVAIGGKGRGLGYTKEAERGSGLDGAYLGIGFDVFGNFKDFVTGRSGFSDSPRPFIGESTRNHITIRGASEINRGGSYNRQEGYPVLYTVNTSEGNSGSPRSSTKNEDGSYHFSNQGPSPAFDLRSDAISKAVGDVDYRKATITLLPLLGGGYRISLIVQAGAIERTILTDFQYPAGTINYRSAKHDDETKSVISGDIPTTFKFGFAGATGLASQIHLIRALEVKLPYMAETSPDVVSLCRSFPQKSVMVYPFENDVVYRGSLTGTPTSGNDGGYVDFTSFQFSDGQDNPLGDTGAADKKYTQDGVGDWTYNGRIGTVTFTPNADFVGKAEIYYTLKGQATGGGPFNQEIYRSEPQKITVDVIHCGAVVNPHVPSGGRTPTKQAVQ